MKDYMKLLRFLKGHTKVLAWAVAFMLVSTAFEGIQFSMIVPITDRILSKGKIIPPGQVPAFLQELINTVNSTEPWALLKIVPFIFIILFFFK